MQGDVVSVERMVAAPPEAIFDLVADAARHPAIDGSGTVREATGSGPRRLSLGATFGMKMKMGVAYSMVNEVIEFEENRRIAWQTKLAGPLGRFVGGRIWRYELEPGDNGTRVRETWDISHDHQRVLLRLGPLPKSTRQNMERTLERIEQIATASAPSSPS